MYSHLKNVFLIHLGQPKEKKAPDEKIKGSEAVARIARKRPSSPVTFKTEPLSNRQEKRVKKEVNRAVKKQLKERLEQAPITLSLDDPEWSTVVEMSRDASKQHLYALEMAVKQVGLNLYFYIDSDTRLTVLFPFRQINSKQL